ncbi:MAG: putative Se/S carrier-like protein [Clostridia bacterium]
MEAALIAFSSSTTANRLKKLAAREQLHGVTMIQTPKAISQNGCTYSIKCPMGTLSALLQLSEAYQIKHGHIYKESTDEEGRKFYQKI